MSFIRILIIFSVLLNNPYIVRADDDAAHLEHVHESSKKLVPISTEQTETTVVVQPHQAVVEVHGVVCSFCAYGIEKKLKVLTALDTSKFSRGIFTDIEAHQVILALQPGVLLDLKQLHGAILDAGYEPIRIHLRVAGTMESEGDGLLTDAETRQQYRLTGELVKGSLEGRVDIQGYIEAVDILTLVEDEPIPLTLTRSDRTS